MITETAGILSALIVSLMAEDKIQELGDRTQETEVGLARDNRLLAAGN